MTIISSRELADLLGKVLCLPPNLYKLEIVLEADQAVTVSTSSYAGCNAGQLASVFAEYDLVQRRHPAEVMGFDAWMKSRTDAAHAAYMLHWHAARSS